jgi:hypothetical protein
MPNRKIFLDTEFIDTGKEIDLISIALVKESGESLYLISSEFDESKADKWLLDNVIRHLPTEGRETRQEIKESIIKFLGKKHNYEFWAHYASYDWVVFCQLFGRMLDLPKNYSYWVRDFKFIQKGEMVESKTKHNALSDAIALKESYKNVMSK